MTVCIDSQVIIWGIKQQATGGQEDMITKAADFFQWIDRNGHEIIIPSVVVAEVLAPEPAGIRSRYLEILNNNFIIVNFDNIAALKYAEILHGRFEDVKRLAADNGVVKQKMKLDHLIISCAIVNGANCIYSYDKGLKSFASGLIDVREFPASQQDLFGNTVII